MSSSFDPKTQERNISDKIVSGLERLSEVFKILLWEQAKRVGISPIQIQMLIFMAYHKTEFCNVSHLAREFNVTKPTISDAVRVLDKKGLVTKDYSSEDSRRYSLLLTPAGQKMVGETETFATPLKSELDNFESHKLEDFFGTLSALIYKLNSSGILQVQRTCFACKFYQRDKDSDYCNLLKKTLHQTDIRLDCPEFEEKAQG